MVTNSINIIKTKERLYSDGQQYHQYHQNKRKLSFVLMIFVELLTITV
jgi:hypothetical protein